MQKKIRVPLNLEIEPLESRGRPGCDGSSSTSRLCTCPVLKPVTD